MPVKPRKKTLELVKALDLRPKGRGFESPL